jgi:hypothetical protein
METIKTLYIAQVCQKKKLGHRFAGCEEPWERLAQQAGGGSPVLCYLYCESVPLFGPGAPLVELYL